MKILVESLIYSSKVTHHDLRILNIIFIHKLLLTQIVVYVVFKVPFIMNEFLREVKIRCKWKQGHINEIHPLTLIVLLNVHWVEQMVVSPVLAVQFLKLLQFIAEPGMVPSSLMTGVRIYLGLFFSKKFELSGVLV